MQYLPEPYNPPSTSTPQLKAKLESFIGKKTKILVSDERFFIGTLACIDKEKNLILQSAMEYNPVGKIKGVLDFN